MSNDSVPAAVDFAHDEGEPIVLQKGPSEGS